MTTRQRKTNYFPHDSNARNDEKLIRLRMRHGAAGYGVYFMLIERLREESDYTSVRDYNVIAFDFRVDAALVKSVVEDFGLFVLAGNDGKYFYSESLLNRMQEKDAAGSSRTLSAKKAAQARWDNTNVTSEPQPAIGKKPMEKKTEGSEYSDVNDVYLDEFFANNSGLLESLMMNLHLAPSEKDKLRKMAGEVVTEWKLSRTSHFGGYQDWSRHLISTIRIKLEHEAALKEKKSRKTPAAIQEQERIAAEMREQENAERNRRYINMKAGAVSYEDAKKTEEYKRAFEGA